MTLAHKKYKGAKFLEGPFFMFESLRYLTGIMIFVSGPPFASGSVR